MKQLIVGILIMLTAACKKTTVEPSIAESSQNASDQSHTEEFQNLQRIDIPEDLHLIANKTAISDNELGAQIYESPEVDITSSGGFTFYSTTGFWMPPAGYSFTMTAEPVGVGAITLKLWSNSSMYGWHRLETNASQVVSRKLIYFSRAKYYPSDNQVVILAYPQSGTVRVKFRCYVRQNSSGGVLQLNQQGWSSLENYLHSDQAAGSHDCGPNSYMMARHLLYPSTYDVSGPVLEAIKKRLEAYSGYISGGRYATVTELVSLAQQDLGSSNATLKSTSNRLDFNSWLTGELVSSHPVIIPIRVCSPAWDICQSGGYGHFIILIGVDKTSDGSGSIVYYKDGLTNDSRTKACDLTVLLNSNYYNSSYGVYSAFSLK